MKKVGLTLPQNSIDTNTHIDTMFLLELSILNDETCFSLISMLYMYEYDDETCFSLISILYMYEYEYLLLRYPIFEYTM